MRAAKPMDTSWLSVIQERPKATYAVSFIAPAVAGFTENWAVGIAPGREREMLEAISINQPPFTLPDLLWFGERDVAPDGTPYLRPDYWLTSRSIGAPCSRAPSRTVEKTTFQVC